MLKAVRVQNFKSFRDVEVKLGTRNFLIGPNRAGKSNFIEVFRFLHRVAFPQPGGRGLANAFPGWFREWTWKGGDSHLMVVSLEGIAARIQDDENLSWNYRLEISSDAYGGVTVPDERLCVHLKSGPAELIVSEGGRRRLVNSDGREVVPGIDRDRAAIEFEIPAWDGGFLRNVIASWRFYRLIPQLMRTVNPAAAPPFLTENGDNLAAWLMQLQTRYPEAFASIEQVCKDVLPGVEKVFTWPTEQATVTVGQRDRHLKRPLQLWEMSDGDLAFLGLLSLIFSPPELAASLYCIEELENHLHPKLIEVLLEILRQAQDRPEVRNPAQVIATTHSLHLVDHARLDELIVFDKREGATVVYHPRDKTHLRELLESSELGLGELYYSGALESG